jgi:hypothetical protein
VSASAGGLSGGTDRPSGGVVGDAERRESGEVHCGSEETEVGVDFGVPAHTSAATGVPASHQMTDLALDLRARGGVVGFPRWVGLPRASTLELLLVDADVDRASTGRGGAPVRQRA